MKLDEVLRQQQKALSDVDEEMMKLAKSGKLTDYYFSQWYYQHVLNYVLLNLVNNRTALLVKNYTSFMKTQGTWDDFKVMSRLAKYSALMTNPKTYQQIHESVLAVLDKSMVLYNEKPVDDGWHITLKQ